MALHRPSKRGVVLALSATVFGVFFTFYPAARFVASAARDRYDSLESFATILAIVQKHYVKEVPPTDLIEGAIKGMVSSLDPHSAYLTPSEYKELQIDTRGEFGGLGIEITLRDDVLTIVTPIDGTPAFRAGAKPNDEIIKIDGEFTREMTLQQAVDKMRGKPGSSVTLSVHREGLPALHDLDIVREIIHIKSVKRVKLLDEHFAYVRLVQFQEGSAQEVAKSLAKIEEDASGEIDGVILDLRYNPGGLLTQAKQVTDLFLDAGLIVRTDGRMEAQRHKFVAEERGTRPLRPLIVIVNEGSASASEIVAGALQDHERALILGAKTFGKGSVQTILPLMDGYALRLTTALYYTPSGRTINGVGVMPDVVVALAAVGEGEDGDSKAEEPSGEDSKESDSGDATIEKSDADAAAGTKPSDDADASGDENAIPDPNDWDYTKDLQLQKALELLRGWEGDIEVVGAIGGFGLDEDRLASADAEPAPDTVAR